MFRETHWLESVISEIKVNIMAKFQVLKYNQWAMSKLGIYSYRLTEPTNEFFTSFGTYYILFMVIGFSIGTSLIYVYLHWPNFDLTFEPIMVFSGNIPTMGMFINTGLQMKKIKILHLKIQEIVNEKGMADFLYNFFFEIKPYSVIHNLYTSRP